MANVALASLRLLEVVIMKVVEQLIHRITTIGAVLFLHMAGNILIPIQTLYTSTIRRLKILLRRISWPFKGCIIDIAVQLKSWWKMEFMVLLLKRPSTTLRVVGGRMAH